MQSSCPTGCGYTTPAKQLDLISTLPLWRGNSGNGPAWRPVNFDSMKPVLPQFNTLPNIQPTSFDVEAPSWRSTIVNGEMQCIPSVDEGVSKEACEALSGMYSMNCPYPEESCSQCPYGSVKCAPNIPMGKAQCNKCSEVENYPWLQDIWKKC